MTGQSFDNRKQPESTINDLHLHLKLKIEKNRVIESLPSALEIQELLTQLLDRREMVKPSHLDPKEIFTSYSDYDGTFNVSHEHIKKIFPEYNEPSDKLLAVRTQLQKDIYGTMPAQESATAIEIVRALKPRTILEIGTHQGHFLKGILEAAPSDTFAISVDLPSTEWKEAKYSHDATQQSYIENCRPDQIGLAIREENSLHDRVGFIKADSGKFDFTPFYGLMDVVVVDGNHTYQAVDHDLETAMKLVSENGIILVDDVNKPFRLEGVTYAVYKQTFEKGKTFYFANHFKGPEGHLAFYLNAPNTFKD